MSSLITALPTREGTNVASESSQVPRRFSVLIAGMLFGAGTQLLFVWTVVGLFQFLRYGGHSGSPFSVTWDASWALFFALPHSILLFPAVSKRLRKYLPGELHGCLHCTATCVSLLVLFEMWSTSSRELWRLEESLSRLFCCVFMDRGSRCSTVCI